MPVDIINDIYDFQKKFKLDHWGKPRCLPHDLALFREKFMHEELTEFSTANIKLQFEMGLKYPQEEKIIGLLAEQLDAMIDLVYVAVGTSLMQFEPRVVEEAWRRVHAANMTKVRASVDNRSTRKGNQSQEYDIVKPPGFTPPDVEGVVREAMRGDG